MGRKEDARLAREKKDREALLASKTKESIKKLDVDLNKDGVIDEKDTFGEILLRYLIKTFR